MESLDIELIKKLFGEAASGEFTKTCAIFALAAFVHARQVRKEIKTQFSLLVGVLRDDLDAQKILLGSVVARVDRIEDRMTKTNKGE